MCNYFHRKLLQVPRLVIFVSVLSACINNSAQSAKYNQQDRIRQYISQLQTRDNDTLSAKNLKALSNFGDTLVINRYLNEIENFEKDDSLNPTRKTDIIFTGSSSIRKWTSLQNDMKELKVLNRGFGGSTIPEVIYYSDILIFKHNPQKIVFYAGENDIAMTKTDSLKVFNSYVYFQKLVKQKLPNTNIYFVSIKLSPSRAQYWNSINATNKMIEQYCNSTTNCTFINVNQYMLGKNGQVRNDLFVKDNLHLNAEGYKIWTNIIYNAIKKQSK